MKSEIQLPKQLPNIIGTDVTISNEVVGKIIKYDSTTGYAEFKLDESAISKLPWSSQAGEDIGIVDKSKYE